MAFSSPVVESFKLKTIDFSLNYFSFFKDTTSLKKLIIMELLAVHLLSYTFWPIYNRTIQV